jgi:hypothetical protein
VIHENEGAPPLSNRFTPWHQGTRRLQHHGESAHIIPEVLSKMTEWVNLTAVTTG